MTAGHSVSIKSAQISDYDNYFAGDPVVAGTNGITKITGTLENNSRLVGTTNFSLTAEELRLLSQLTVWQELNMLHKPYYNDFLNAHFDGVRVGEDSVVCEVCKISFIEIPASCKTSRGILIP